MKPAPHQHTSPLLRPAGVPAPTAALNIQGGFKSSVPGVQSAPQSATPATLTVSTGTASFPTDAGFGGFPHLVAHYNGSQPPLGMFSVWELRQEGDESERPIASVMADNKDGEAWMSLFKAAPLLLENNQASVSMCHDARRELSAVIRELSQIPGMEDVIRRINEVEGKLLHTAADFDAVVRQIEAACVLAAGAQGLAHGSEDAIP